MKIVLTSFNCRYLHPNMAIRILRNDLLIDDIKSDLKEYSIKEDLNTVKDDLIKYDLVGISCYIYNIEQVKQLCILLKKANPNIIIVLGGPEVSFLKEIEAKQLVFDYIVCNEGEVVFKRLIHNIIYNVDEKIDSVIYNHNNHIIMNKMININELESFEKITNTYDDVDLKNQIAYLETSRGCPYLCSYCLASLDNNIRLYDINNVLNKIQYLLDNNARLIKLLDRTFNFDVKRTNQIIKYIIDHDNNYSTFQFEITGELLDQSSIELINDNARVGLFRFEIGIQSTNDETNYAVNRYQNFDKLKDIILKIQASNKIVLHLDLIAGLPYEDLERFKKTFNDVISLYPKELQLGFLKLLKGTKLNDSVIEYDYVFESIAPYEIISNKWLSNDDLNIISDVEHVLNKIYNQRSFHDYIVYYLKKYQLNQFEFFNKLYPLVFIKSNQHHDKIRSIEEIYYILLNQFTLDDNDKIQLLINYHTSFNKRVNVLTKVDNSKQVLHELIEKASLVQNDVFNKSIIEQINDDLYLIKVIKDDYFYLMNIKKDVLRKIGK